ncbi:MAG: ISAs1 family transposase, partial [Acidimicrobiales bacterium]
MATAATLAGARSVAAIGEYAADCPQEVLARLGAKYHPVRRCYVAPHLDTFRRALGAIDAAALDRAVGAWLFDQARRGRVGDDDVVLALDGKSLRGALGGQGRAVHLFSAMVHGSGLVVGQEEVDEKSNEITALRPLLEGLDIAGALVTADALHAQRDHARFVVEEQKADYLFQVKENQPSLLAAIKAVPEADLSPEHESTSRGHGRTEHRYVRVADAPEGVDFPHAAQVVVVYRERADLADVLASAETSYYVTSVAKGRAGAERLGAHVRGHWGIENKVHWARDWSFDEDRHRLRAPGATARARRCATSPSACSGSRGRPTSVPGCAGWHATPPGAPRSSAPRAQHTTRSQRLLTTRAAPQRAQSDRHHRHDRIEDDRPDELSLWCPFTGRLPASPPDLHGCNFAARPAPASSDCSAETTTAPGLLDVIEAVRGSGACDLIRLCTNGVMLPHTGMRAPRSGKHLMRYRSHRTPATGCPRPNGRRSRPKRSSMT